MEVIDMDIIPSHADDVQGFGTPAGGIDFRVPVGGAAGQGGVNFLLGPSLPQPAAQGSSEHVMPLGTSKPGIINSSD
jgi:hypothetical protein